MGGFSFWHILLVALLVMLLFGGKRFSAMMGDVAKGLKNFKAGMADDESEQRYGTDQQRDRGRLGASEPPIDVIARQHATDPFAPPPPPQEPRA